MLGTTSSALKKTKSLTPAKRQQKIYLDYLQNKRGQTLVAPYSPRPRAGAPVSTPLRWEEVTAALNPLDFNLKTVPARLGEIGDLWRPILTEAVDLSNIFSN